MASPSRQKKLGGVDNRADLIGSNVSITSLAYSGPKHNMVACMDASGELLLLDAASMDCIVRLNAPDMRTLSGRLRGRVAFVHREDGDCLLTQVGGVSAVSGAIALWNLDQAAVKGDNSLHSHNRHVNIAWVSHAPCMLVIIEELCALYGHEWPVASVAARLNSDASVYGASNGAVVLTAVGAKPRQIRPPLSQRARVQAMSGFPGERRVSYCFVYGTTQGDVTVSPRSYKATGRSEAQYCLASRECMSGDPLTLGASVSISVRGYGERFAHGSQGGHRVVARCWPAKGRGRRGRWHSGD